MDEWIKKMWDMIDRHTHTLILVIKKAGLNYLTMQEGMATHFSTLAWRIPWTEELAELHRIAKQWT